MQIRHVTHYPFHADTRSALDRAASFELGESDRGNEDSTTSCVSLSESDTLCFTLSRRGKFNVATELFVESGDPDSGQY